MKLLIMITIAHACFTFAHFCSSEHLQDANCPADICPADINLNPAPKSLSKPDYIYLENVSTLTFVNGGMTKSIRTNPKKQISCVGDFCELVPDTIKCHNLGFSIRSGDYEWDCYSSQLPKGMIISSANVNCEGYESKNDSRISEGSCGLSLEIRKVNFIIVLLILLSFILIIISYPDIILMVICGAIISSLFGSDYDDDDSFHATTSRR